MNKKKKKKERRKKIKKPLFPWCILYTERVVQTVNSLHTMPAAMAAATRQKANKG